MSVLVSIRPLSRADSVDELTTLIHAAYQRLWERGWNFNGGDQTANVTAQRADLGICLVAESEGTLLGTITVHGPFPSAPCDHLTRDDIAYFQQFAVDPSGQQLGIGSKLLQHAEACARAAGYSFLYTDTADEATDLLRFYSRHGYAPVAHMQWPGKTYRSVVLSKAL